ncbi:uncharacterized protein [Rutidosis leptorrhynchoides]|uniref:uncharacterized protein isoform X2 n=1 Tax=Rutidosis leptorrhynchoides TaxID=125765 RepID=UPI003A996F34
MGSTFNSQILVEKLAKLNSSQQSIETLSHWCIFHMNNAKQVVETWATQFHCSPRDQRLAFLYLANDILQNSRRKGSEFVDEFWKVLSDALHDVIDSKDESGRKAALRLVNIWEERKVFGSQGEILKKELVGRHVETSNRNEKHSGSAGNALEKIVSGYQAIYGGQHDEDLMINKCKNTISCIVKVEKDIGSDIKSAQVNGSGILEELKGHHATLRDCIQQLSAAESSRINLVCNLREALQEQEVKLREVRNELKAARTQSENADTLCRKLLNPVSTINTPKAHSYIPGSGDQSAPAMYARLVPISNQPNETTKSAAAAVAEKLTASTSSAEMLSYVLSSLASGGVISNNTVNQPPEKRAKIENDQNSQSSDSSHDQQPSLPPLQAYSVSPFVQTAATVPYGYITNQQLPAPFVGHPNVVPQINGGGSYALSTPPTGYQSFQMEGGFSSQTMAPTSSQ